MLRVILTPYHLDNEYDFFANSYLVIDERNNALIIDPGKDNNEAIDFINKSNLHLKAILLTHGHFDHIGNVDTLIKEFGVPVFIHGEDAKLLKDPRLNCSNNLSIKSTPTIINEDKLHLIDEEVNIIYTPYHTKGSVCYYFKDSGILFTGDSLFKGSVGRSDLPTGSLKDMNSSLKKIVSLPKETKIYPGHGEMSTIGEELITNSFVNNL